MAVRLSDNKVVMDNGACSLSRASAEKCARMGVLQLTAIPPPGHGLQPTERINGD